MPANYTALTAAWNGTPLPYLPAGVSGTALASGMTAPQKLAAMQGWTVAGPMQDVTVAQVVGYLAIAGKLTALKAYAATASPTAGTNAAGVTAANDLMTLLGLGGATPIQMSQPSIAAGVEALLAALVADTANSGIAASDQTALLALAQGAAVPWWKATVAAGGAGLSGLTEMDLTAAGLATSADFQGA